MLSQGMVQPNSVIAGVAWAKHAVPLSHDARIHRHASTKIADARP